MPKLKTRRDLRRVKFNKKENKPIRIGGNLFGNVYIGTAFFKDGKRHRVAIKVFTDEKSLRKAATYQTGINKLRKAGVELLKTEIVKIPTERKPGGEWVQVSELYGSTGKGSKIESKSLLKIKGKENREKAARQLAKIANIGFDPTLDSIESRKDGKGIYVIDLDFIIRGKIKANYRADKLLLALRMITEDMVERKQLFKIMAKNAGPEVEQAFKKALQTAAGKRTL